MNSFASFVSVSFGLAIFAASGGGLLLWKSRRPSTRSFLLSLLGFGLGLALAGLAPLVVRMVSDKYGHGELPVEVQRTSSPDGLVDAVLEVTGCGAPCSDTYSLSVVPKGNPGSPDTQRMVLSVDDLVKPTLSWKENRLLEFGYKRALVNEFRNVCYPFAKFGEPNTWEYKVEIRLAPDSAGFSYLDESKSN